MRIRVAFLGLMILIASAMQGAAIPNCTLPYTLQNGQTADATQVMADLNAIIGSGCVGSAASAGANSDITALNGLTTPVPTPGGFLNKFRNGTMDVWQRGSSAITVATTGAYTADGWIVVPSGASATVQRASGRLLTAYSLQAIGATGVTDIIVKQRIESVIAASLSGQTVTVQARVYNNTGNSITPTLTVKHAGSSDNWASPIIDVNAASLQSAANGQWTQVAYTFAASSSSSNGLEISFDFLNNFASTSQSVQLTELDLRATPGLATGLNSNPPPPELHSIAAELAFCQRYYTTSYGNWTAPGTATNNGVTPVTTFLNGSFFSYHPVIFPTQMRASPTISYYDAGGNASKMSSQSITSGGAFSLTNNLSNTGTGVALSDTVNFTFQGFVSGTSGIYLIHYTASAEL